MYETAKRALTKAIRDFFTQDEILSEDFLRQAAADFVYEHDEDIREHFRDKVNTDDIFDSILDEIEWYDIW